MYWAQIKHKIYKKKLFNFKYFKHLIYTGLMVSYVRNHSMNLTTVNMSKLIHLRRVIINKKHHQTQLYEHRNNILFTSELHASVLTYCHQAAHKKTRNKAKNINIPYICIYIYFL